MKKLLIIQQDEAYFLFETLMFLERYTSDLKDYEVTILASSSAVSRLKDAHTTTFKLISDIPQALVEEYDLSTNLSLLNSSAELHSLVKSNQKIGPEIINGQLSVPELWSTFYMTVQGKTPFLTFHLQDIFKNIFGIKRIPLLQKKTRQFKTIAFGLSAPHMFSATEQEKFIEATDKKYSFIGIQDVSEVDLVEDLSHVLYIGPATLEALILCEQGAQGIFLTSHFQGFNMIPQGPGNYLLSTQGKAFHAKDLGIFLDKLINQESFPHLPFSIYETDEEHIFGTHLKNLNHCDDNYPFYQAHLVLWNFVLNLFDVNLDIAPCEPHQLEILGTNQKVMNKLIRLYDYALTSIDTIYNEAKGKEANASTIKGHINNLKDIEEVSEKLAQSHIFLRPFLDYYKIRRSQIPGANLLEQAQESFLTYSEEHQILKAFSELISVTLRKNEANI